MKRTIVGLVGLVVLLLVPPDVRAQVGGSIAGVVRDTSAAVLPGEGRKGPNRVGGRRDEPALACLQLQDDARHLGRVHDAGEEAVEVAG